MVAPDSKPDAPTKNPAKGPRLESLLLAVFLLCVVQFGWLSSRLLQRQHHDLLQDFAGVPSRPVLESPVLAKRVAKLNELADKQRKKKNRWDPGVGLKDGKKPLKVQLPIFVPSLPKSGTTSIWQYFQCGGWRASHQWTRIDDDEEISENSSRDPASNENRTITLIGACMHDNVQHDRPTFQGCGGDPIYTDTGYARFKVLPSGAPGTPLCYYPSISALDDVARHYPNATILLVVREPESWAESIMTWGNGTLLFRWGSCNFPNLPNPPSLATKAQLIDFYRWHNDNVRRKFPNLIEVSLEGAATGQQLQDAIGLPASCWGKCTPLSKFCQHLAPDNATSQVR
jgi:Sulfotransferase domain